MSLSTTMTDLPLAAGSMRQSRPPPVRLSHWPPSEPMSARRTGTSVTFPQLPVFGFDFNPTTDDLVGVDELTTANVPGTYHDARPVGFTDFTSLVIGTTHRMVVQSLNALEP